MGIWIADVLPIGAMEILPAISLIIIGLIVETHYVGRVALFANAVALSTFFYKISEVPGLLILYINLLTLVGVLALLSYAIRMSLPRIIYLGAGVFSSVISGILLLYGLTFL